MLRSLFFYLFDLCYSKRASAPSFLARLAFFNARVARAPPNAEFYSLKKVNFSLVLENFYFKNLEE